VRAKGAVAENAAICHLCAHGLTLITKNYRSRFGEIDLVMREGNTLVFVEVRQRASDAFGGAAQSITPRKQRRIVATARVYLANLSVSPPCRFDAVLLSGNDHLEWIRDAFSAYVNGGVKASHVAAR